MTNKEDYRIVTAPVLIPGVPDCDYQNGEQPLTPEEIKYLMNSFKKYNIIDHNHDYMFDGPWYLRRLGTPVDSWQTTEETTYTDRFDVERTTPPGTWYLKTKITDPEAIQLIDDEILNSYSLTTASRTLADKFLDLTKGVSAKSVTYTGKEVTELLRKHGMISKKHRTLLHDVPDPVGFTVSLTDFPCVGGSVFSKKCLANTSQTRIDEQVSNKNGSDKMTETTEIENNRFSVDDFKSLFSFFTSMKSEEKEEPKETPKEEPKETPKEEPKEKEEYVTREELDQAFEENNEKLISQIGQLIDEKLKDKEEEKEEDEEKEGEEGSKEGKQKEGETPKPKEEKEKISTKSQSKQIDDPDPQEEEISYKKGTPEYQILKGLGRDALGNTKIKL